MSREAPRVSRLIEGREAPAACRALGRDVDLTRDSRTARRRRAAGLFLGLLLASPELELPPVVLRESECPGTGGNGAEKVGRWVGADARMP